MKQFEIIMPKMGESIEEATIIKWFVKPGDTVREDDILLEIATDKVDSEIPSPVEGTIREVLYQQDETVKVGSVIAVIDLTNTESSVPAESTRTGELKSEKIPETVITNIDIPETVLPDISDDSARIIMNSKTSRFYSPLVRNIAREEKISLQELDTIKGTGYEGRVRKKDLLDYLNSRKIVPSTSSLSSTVENTRINQIATDKEINPEQPIPSSDNSADEIIQMDRIRKITADHMIKSRQISAHVTNIIEVDATNIVNWRNRIKDAFEKKEGQKITYLPIFLECVIQGIKDFPMINSSVDGDRIIIKKRINLGIAVALPNYNLIVPVIKNADHLSLTGLTKEMNRLANAARNSQLKPDEIQDGTFTITNFGSFKNLTGTPIINQPQVAILAVGAIGKKPAVLETPQGDVIAIRHKMYLSLTYDHRIIDGSLGGSFLRKVGDYIESFDISRSM